MHTLVQEKQLQMKIIKLVTICDGSAAIPEFKQQLNIVKAARDVLDSTLIDLTSILQADLFDSELDSARALMKSGFFRLAGAICGVIIEKHLSVRPETL